MPININSLFDVAHFVTFLSGALVGGAGQYLAERFTDQRKKQELESFTSQQFEQLKKEMPALFEEMRQDIQDDKSHSTREFFIVPNKRLSVNSSKPRFIYYEDEHPHLRLQVDRLFHAGYFDDVTVGNTPIYRMKENFVKLLGKVTN